MLTTKKVIEEAIKVREKEIEKINRCEPEMVSDLYSMDEQIEHFQSQITELKQSLQIIYDANNNK